MSTTNSAGLTLPILNTAGGSGATTASAAFINLSPLTTKGDLIAYTGSNNVNLPVGADTYILVANSGAADGINWIAPANVTSAGITSTTMTIGSSPITTSGTMTVNIPASVAGNNMLLNASMELYMRQTSQSSASSGTLTSGTYYTLDRWQMKVGTTTGITVKQVAGATSGSWLAQIQRNNGDTNTSVIYFAQSLTRDMCLGAAGNKVSLSFKAASGANFSAASSNLTVTVYSGTGTSDISGIAGAFTGSSSVISTTATLSSTLTAFSATSGSTLGATVTQLCVEFSYAGTGTAGANDLYQITDVQLEISPTVTNFNRKTDIDVYSECARFYLKGFQNGTAPAQNAATNIFWTAANAAALADPSHTFTFPVTMRATPTMTLYNTSANNAQARDQTAAADCSSTTATASTSGFYIACTGAVGTVVGNSLAISFQADAEIT